MSREFVARTWPNFSYKESIIYNSTDAFVLRIFAGKGKRNMHNWKLPAADTEVTDTYMDK
jgi:hypothetical protein